MRWVILWGGKGYEMEHESFDGKWKACDFHWEENIYYKTRGSCNKIIVEVKMENNWFSTKVISYQKWMASLKEKKHEGPKVIFYNEWMVSLTLWKKGQRVTTSRRGWLLWQGGVDGFFSDNLSGVDGFFDNKEVQDIGSDILLGVDELFDNEEAKDVRSGIPLETFG